MFLLKKPSTQQISRFVLSQANAPFSYTEVGATRDNPPHGYVVDRNRVKLGHGERVFSEAVSGIKHWRQFDLGWVNIAPQGVPVEVGSVVAIVTKQLGLWSLSACRVVYVVNESRRFGFAYGTLLEHVEQGEERFSIEWNEEDGSVWYDILAFSRPNKLVVKIGSRYARMLQKKFAQDSKQRMVKHVEGIDSR